jgi:hypothetical protein
MSIQIQALLGTFVFSLVVIAKTSAAGVVKPFVVINAVSGTTDPASVCLKAIMEIWVGRILLGDVFAAVP